MRWLSAAPLLLALGACLSTAAASAQQAPAHDDVLAAIAADAAPEQNSPLQSQRIEQAEAVQPTELAPQGVCSLRVAGQWQPRPQLTLEQCADALEKSPEPYDASGYKQAYWQGVFLLAGPKGVYQSRNNSDWTPLREHAAP